MERLVYWLKRAALVVLIASLAVGLAYSFPADLALIFAIDLGTWVEAVVAVTVAAQVTRIRPLLAWVRARFLSRRAGSGRQRRMRLPAARRQPSNDDDPGGLFAVAA